MTTAEEKIDWYALKVFYNKVFRAEEMLKERGVECYVPTETVVVQRGEEKRKIRRAVIPSLMFVRTDSATLADIESQKSVAMSSYKRRCTDGSLEAVAIPQREMEVFILVSSSGEKGLEYYDASKANFKEGSKVRVIDGLFKGSEGYIKRIKGNRRFIVCINGVCAVATPYIPVAFLQKLDE